MPRVVTAAASGMAERTAIRLALAAATEQVAGVDRPVVFVHTDNSQLLPALVSIHSLRTRGGGNEGFDVRLLRLEGSPLDARSDGRRFSYAHHEMTWDHTRAWSFHYLRRSVPDSMGYRGRALVIDPDIFAVGSILPLLKSDMEGKAIWSQIGRASCRERV